MNTERPTFEQIYMQFAKTLSQRSTCKRLHVGTVIASSDYRQVLAVGYNGNASGLDNDACKQEQVGNCGCLHSEENAVINCTAPRTVPKIVFVTALPCMMCAKRLINLGGVMCVYYASEYRSDDSLAFFKEAGIEIRKRQSNPETP